MVELRHATVAPGVDSGDGKISKNAWNESHTLTGTANTLLSFNGSGASQELDAAASRAFLGLGTAALSASTDFAPAGAYLTSISSGDVTTALGYTPTSVTGLTGAQSIAAFKTGLTLVKADVGLSSVDNTADSAKNVLSATKLTTVRTINGVSFDGTTNITINAVDSTARLASSAVSAFMLTVLDDTTAAAARTTLGAQAAGSYLTANQTITLSGDVTGSGSTAITTTLATVNSNTGTFGGAGTVPQISVNGKGLVTGVTAVAITPTAIGLGNVNNTSDANKPVSTAQQTALDLKAPLNSPLFTGTVSVSGSLLVSGGMVAAGGTQTFGPTSGAASDLSLTFNNTNFYNFIDFNSWSGGVSQTDGQFLSVRGYGLIFKGRSNIAFRDLATNNDILALSLGTATLTGSLTASSFVTSASYMAAQLNTDGQVVVGTDGVVGNITIGKAGRTLGNSPFIDFCSSANAPTYDVRIQVTGGSSGSVGQGTLTFKAAASVFEGDVTVPDEAYDATAWNGSLEVPTKNAVRDKIEALSLAAGVNSTRQINTTAPLTGGGDLSADRTLAISAATTSAAGSMSAADKTRLDALYAPYRTILDCSGSHTAARVAGLYGFTHGQPLAISGTGTLYPLDIIYIDSADYPAIGSLAAKLRIRCTLSVNDVAPTGNFTIALHPVTRPATSGGAGLVIYTIGAAVSGSGVTSTAPAADSINNLVGADFALPANGHYVVAMTSTATVATSSHLHLSAALQLHYA